MQGSGLPTHTERIERIGELLAKGVALMLLDEARKRRASHHPESDGSEGVATPSGNPRSNARTSKPTSLSEPTCPVVDYLGRVQTASPRDIQRALTMSKATVFRRLNSLIKAGTVVCSGHTTSIRYSLASQSQRQLFTKPDTHI